MGTLPALVLVAVLTAGCAPDWAPPDPDSIARADVERVIATLAADDMRGRAAFTEDAGRAAAYLAGEFEAAGLIPMEGLGGYLQEFEVREIMPGPATVTVNGVTLGADAYTIHMGSEAIDWSTGDVEVYAAGAGLAPDAAMVGGIQTFESGGNAVVFLHPEHAAVFAQASSFFNRNPQRVIGEPVAGTLALILTEASEEAEWSITAEAVVERTTLANVAGVLPGNRTDEIVLFSAHYDHLGVRSVAEGDSIANGANDNASGVAAVVALADYFAERGTPERTLVFVGFTAEEAGGFGSRHFSEQLEPDQIVAMFNIEMIGKPAVEGPNSAWITGFERSSFGMILQEAVEGTVFSFYPDPYPDQNLFYRSDNATLARLGVPAHSISTTPIDVDPDYHRVTDDIETLNLDHTTNAVRAIATGAESIVTGQATPTRVDPATVEGE